MDLIEFLRARLDEDEAVARKAAPPPWSVAEVPTPSGVGKGKMGAIVSPEAKTAPVALAIYWRYDEESAEHIARWDPARVLAEVEAKRQVIEYAEATEDVSLPSECWALGRYMVRALAQPYADHPDFAPAWLLTPA